MSDADACPEPGPQEGSGPAPVPGTGPSAAQGPDPVAADPRTPETAPPAATADDRNEDDDALPDLWNRLDDLGDECGYFEPLGPHHGVVLLDQGPTLLVSFVHASDLDPESDLSPAHKIAERHGWSALTIVADRLDWFRARHVYAYFDRLVDDAFFEDFDRVVFYGAGAGGYAAAAFSVTAPGATVIAVHPQATLDPRLTGWDDRFRAHRRLSFTDRYGFAPDMLEGAEAGFIIYDPHQTEDALHAALFARPHVELLPCPDLGANIALVLGELDLLDPLLTAAGEGRLDTAFFRKLMRARRNSPRYLRMVLARLEEQDRLFLAALLCRNVARRLHGPRFRARLTRLEDELRAKGRTLPPARSPAAQPEAAAG